MLGIELDPAATEQERGRHAVPVMVGPLQEATVPTNQFDLTNLGHVIEHLYDPVSFLSGCRRLLKVGGRLFLTTPNVDSLRHLEFQEHWRGLEPPRHSTFSLRRPCKTCVEKGGSKRRLFALLRNRLLCLAHQHRLLLVSSQSLLVTDVSLPDTVRSLIRIPLSRQEEIPVHLRPLFRPVRRARSLLPLRCELSRESWRLACRWMAPRTR